MHPPGDQSGPRSRKNNVGRNRGEQDLVTEGLFRPISCAGFAGNHKSVVCYRLDGSLLGAAIVPAAAIKAVQRDSSPFDAGIVAKIILRQNAKNDGAGSHDAAEIAQFYAVGKSRYIFGVGPEPDEITGAIPRYDKEEHGSHYEGPQTQACCSSYHRAFNSEPATWDRKQGGCGAAGGFNRPLDLIADDS